MNISQDDNLIKALVSVTKDKFEFNENPDEPLQNYYKTALLENRFKYIYDGVMPMGFMVFFLYNSEECLRRVHSEGTFETPKHNPQGIYCFVDTCIIMEGRAKRTNFLHLRKTMLKEFPQIKYFCWHKTIGDKKKLFMLEYGGKNDVK